MLDSHPLSYISLAQTTTADELTAAQERMGLGRKSDEGRVPFLVCRSWYPDRRVVEEGEGRRHPSDAHPVSTLSQVLLTARWGVHLPIMRPGP